MIICKLSAIVIDKLCPRTSGYRAHGEIIEIRLWSKRAARIAIVEGRIGGSPHHPPPSCTISQSSYPSFLFFQSCQSQRIVLAIMAPQLNTAQYILIKTLLKEGFETRIIASEASCSERAVQMHEIRGRLYS